jgi:hypothetical protein
MRGKKSPHCAAPSALGPVISTREAETRSAEGMQYDMDVGGDAVPRRYLARVMAQPQRATVWGVRIRSGTPASSVWTLWLETWALPHRARLSCSSPSAQWVGCSISSPGPHGLVLSPHPCASIRPRHAQPTGGLTARMKRPQTKHRPPCTLHSGSIHTPPPHPHPTPTHPYTHNEAQPSHSSQPSTFCSRHPVRT